MKDAVKNSMQAASGNEEMLASVIEFFPFPIQVYRADGTMVLTNQACMNLMHFQSKEQVVGKFNVLTDPVIDSWGDGVREQIVRSFQGEMVQFQDLRLPEQDIADRFDIDEIYLDARFMNITCFPIFGADSRLAYVVHVFVTARVYDGRQEMVKAKAYIERNWLEEFDLDKAAGSVHLSRHYFSRLFKRYTAMTPYSYYQEVKIARLKEMLHDENRSVTDAFSACGISYSGNYARIFKEKVGMTPSQYRKSLANK